MKNSIDTRGRARTPSLTPAEIRQMYEGDRRWIREKRPALQARQADQSIVVVNRRYSNYDIYIGRPSRWGNPFKIGADGTRQQVIDKYREWVVKQPELMAALHELRGKRLGCWCKPRACHGDVLVELLEQKGEGPCKIG